MELKEQEKKKYGGNYSLFYYFFFFVSSQTKHGKSVFFINFFLYHMFQTNPQISPHFSYKKKGYNPKGLNLNKNILSSKQFFEAISLGEWLQG